MGIIIRYKECYGPSPFSTGAVESSWDGTGVDPSFGRTHPETTRRFSPFSVS